MNRLRILAWTVVGLWVLAAFLVAPLAGKAATVESTDPTLALPAGAEATRALVRERQTFPGADAPVAVVVYLRESGLTPADVSTVDSDRVAFAPLSRANAVDPALPSDDGKALLLAFPIAGDDTQAKAVVDRIRQRLAVTASPGLRTEVTGSAGAGADASDAFGGFETTLLLAAGAVVAVLLLVTYRSPVLWIVPLLSVGLAGQVATGLVYLLGRYANVTVTATSAGLMIIISYGVGTDYALLLIARYREELRRRTDRYAAMATAVRRSLPALLAAAGTVVAGMACLLAARQNTLRGLGPVAATGIVVTFLVMTTLLPALLVLLGRWVFWPRIPRAESVAAQGIWRTLANAVGRRPRTGWVVSALALTALTGGVAGIHLGQPADELYTRQVGSVLGQRLVAAHYPSGTSAPVRLVGALSTVDELVAVAGRVDGVAGVHRSGDSGDGRWVRVDAVLTDPPDSARAKATVDRIREAVHRIPGADVLVGGPTATVLDLERAESRDNAVVMPLILAVVLAILVLLLRALVAPVLLAVSVVLSYLAAWGAAGLAFRALGYPGVDRSLLLWCFLFLVTLGVDYTIFLMTRAREEVARLGHRDGVLSALAVTGGVITSAGAVLAATFGTLTLLPIVALFQLGFAVSVGVLLDTLVVRTVLVPALAVDLGPRVWWPGSRARSTPRRETVDLAA
jgi:putative drug exporter of the RND superfamily